MGETSAGNLASSELRGGFCHAPPRPLAGDKPPRYIFSSSPHLARVYRVDKVRNCWGRHGFARTNWI